MTPKPTKDTVLARRASERARAARDKAARQDRAIRADPKPEWRQGTAKAKLLAAAACYMSQLAKAKAPDAPNTIGELQAFHAAVKDGWTIRRYVISKRYDYWAVDCEVPARPGKQNGGFRTIAIGLTHQQAEKMAMELNTAVEDFMFDNRLVDEV